MLKTTPLTEEHGSLGAKLAPFGGWLMPIQYEGIIAEHMWTRQNVSLFDICHMGEFFICGDAEASGLNRILTFELSTLPVGACRYGFMLNESGGIIDDVIVYRLAEQEWMVVVNASTIEGDETHIRGNLAGGTIFKNASSELGKLDLQGPRSLETLRKYVGPKVAALKYYTFGYFTLFDEKIIISRTGYTGELGYEIYISNKRVKELWRSLLEDMLVKPAGLGARDTLRLEMCYPLYGQDLTNTDTPLEADKERFVDFNKSFIGKAALQKKTAAYRKLICFSTQSRRAPRHNYLIYKGGEEIGIVTSGSYSPSLACGIGMGYVTLPCRTGEEIVLKASGVEIAAVVTDKPFYRKGSAKSSEGSHAYTG